MKKIVIILLPLLILLSCSVQKRKYQKGFYVSSSRSKTQTKKPINDDLVIKHKKENKPETIDQIIIGVNTEPKTDVEASADIKLKPIKLITKAVFSLQKDDPCDLITLKNGEEVSAKVLEITSIEVKYKKCDSPDGPLYVVKKSDVFMIKYSNGTKEVFKATEEPKNSNQNNNSNNSGGQRTTHELAILALIAGIAGFLFFIGSIPAIIMGNSAIKKINAEPDKYDGIEMAKIGKVLGIIGLVLKIALFVLIFAIAFSI